MRSTVNHYARGATLCLGLVVAGTGCSKKQPDAPPAPAAPAPAQAPAEKAPAAAPEAKAPAEPEAKDPVDQEAKAPADPVAPAAPEQKASEEWLVWADTPTGWRTRWVALSGDGFESVAEKGALVISDGTRLWRLDRQDATVALTPCACEEQPDSEDCKKAQRVARPGLAAVPLPDGASVRLYGSDEAMEGDDYDASVSVAAGVGSRVFLDWSESGFFCGAHGSNTSGLVSVDPASGERPVDWQSLKDALPREVLATAAAEVHRGKTDCDAEEAGTVDDVQKEMRLDSVRASVGADGAVVLHWTFAAEVPYACSADYAASGSATSGLVDGAQQIGLAGPLPAGLLKATAGFAGASRVGWAKLDVKGDARDKLLAAFRDAAEPRWPSPAAAP